MKQTLYTTDKQFRLALCPYKISTYSGFLEVDDCDETIENIFNEMVEGTENAKVKYNHRFINFDWEAYIKNIEEGLKTVFESDEFREQNFPFPEIEKIVYEKFTLPPNYNYCNNDAVHFTIEFAEGIDPYVWVVSEINKIPDGMKKFDQYLIEKNEKSFTGSGWYVPKNKNQFVEWINEGDETEKESCLELALDWIMMKQGTLMPFDTFYYEFSDNSLSSDYFYKYDFEGAAAAADEEID
jgi:hypothetical protein